MSRMIPSLLAAAAMALPSMAFAADWNVDDSHSSAQFKVRHLMVSTVRGEFGKVSGTVQYDAKAPEKMVIEATIDASSINTRNKDRDDHLRGADFFDVAKFPTLTFKSTSAKKLAKDKFAVTGNLTMKGVTKPVTLEVVGLDKEVTDPWGNTRVGASATGKINRKDWGLGWNQALEAGGVMVGDEVELVIDAELIKKKAEDKKTAATE